MDTIWGCTPWISFDHYVNAINVGRKRRRKRKMAAFDTFSSFNDALLKSEGETLSMLKNQVLEELLCARSEDAQLRIVENYIVEARKRLLALKQRKEKI